MLVFLALLTILKALPSKWRGLKGIKELAWILVLLKAKSQHSSLSVKLLKAWAKLSLLTQRLFYQSWLITFPINTPRRLERTHSELSSTSYLLLMSQLILLFSRISSPWLSSSYQRMSKDKTLRRSRESLSLSSCTARLLMKTTKSTKTTWIAINSQHLDFSLNKHLNLSRKLKTLLSHQWTAKRLVLN